MAHCYILVRVDIPEGEDPFAVIEHCDLSISVDQTSLRYCDDESWGNLYLDEEGNLYLDTEIKHVYDQNDKPLF